MKNYNAQGDVSGNIYVSQRLDFTENYLSRWKIFSKSYKMFSSFELFMGIKSEGNIKKQTQLKKSERL